MLAHTQSGTLEGVERGGVSAFRGVPYAASPTGALRWRPPQAAMAWAGVRPAGTFGNGAAQSPLLGVAEPLDEDCLYLNVWTPGTDDAAPPVMVWIHGGAFELGAGSQAIYDGARLALRGDVVVVTINYRMGPFGFLRLVDATGGAVPATGSEGMLDMVAALEWVAGNIAGFGGDPGNVTVFGESAGRIVIAGLLAMSRGRGAACLVPGRLRTPCPTPCRMPGSRSRGSAIRPPRRSASGLPTARPDRRSSSVNSARCRRTRGARSGHSGTGTTTRRSRRRTSSSPAIASGRL